MRGMQNLEKYSAEDYVAIRGEGTLSTKAQEFFGSTARSETPGWAVAVRSSC
jgi:hypothetical protein